ncbi:uncharacterized protein LOC128219531 isoform X1 [Mya arenaria]|uniref:uncharacterized protein LOC128219531 isoform X1 n=1 Tax=Mya arenaria TaxID=6604 RepID=UPI0022E691FC|nr:uncharacterized protein LOC128219531 isoform X1 [Mya arenaria]
MEEGDEYPVRRFSLQEPRSAVGSTPLPPATPPRRRHTVTQAPMIGSLECQHRPRYVRTVPRYSSDDYFQEESLLPGQQYVHYSPTHSHYQGMTLNRPAVSHPLRPVQEVQPFYSTPVFNMRGSMVQQRAQSGPFFYEEMLSPAEEYAFSPTRDSSEVQGMHESVAGIRYSPRMPCKSMWPSGRQCSDPMMAEEFMRYQPQADVSPCSLQYNQVGQQVVKQNALSMNQLHSISVGGQQYVPVNSFSQMPVAFQNPNTMAEQGYDTQTYPGVVCETAQMNEQQLSAAMQPSIQQFGQNVQMVQPIQQHESQITQTNQQQMIQQYQQQQVQQLNQPVVPQSDLSCQGEHQPSLKGMVGQSSGKLGDEDDIPAWQTPYVPLKRVKKTALVSSPSEENRLKVPELERENSSEDGRVGESIMRKHSSGSASSSPRFKKRVSFEDDPINRVRSFSAQSVTYEGIGHVGNNERKLDRKISYEEEPPKRFNTLKILKVEKMSDGTGRQDEVYDRQYSIDSIGSNEVFSKETPEECNNKEEENKLAKKDRVAVLIKQESEPGYVLRRGSDAVLIAKTKKERQEEKRRHSMCPMTAYNLRGSSTVAIDNKIEQAMDLVKSHLMFAVREEVEVLKEQIAELIERNNQLEYENGILRAAASTETLAKLAQPRQQPPSSSS